MEKRAARAAVALLPNGFGYTATARPNDADDAARKPSNACLIN